MKGRSQVAERTSSRKLLTVSMIAGIISVLAALIVFLISSPLGFYKGAASPSATATHSTTASPPPSIITLRTLSVPGSQSVSSVAFSPDARLLATGDANGKTYVWSTSTNKLNGILTDPGSKGVNAVAFSPDGRSIATGGIIH